jgi:hypothetical protein
MSLLFIIFIVCLAVISLNYALSHWSCWNYYLLRHYLSTSFRLNSVSIRQRYCQSLRAICVGCSLDREDAQCLLPHLFIGELKQVQVPKGCVYFVFLYLGNTRRCTTKFGSQVVLNEMLFLKTVEMREIIKWLSALSRTMSWNTTVYFTDVASKYIYYGTSLR